jgi:hypothetical protein
MKLSTNCAKCVFAKQADNKEPCEFGIITGIKELKNTEIKDNYYYINDYVCKYGFSKDKILNINNDFPEIDIKEYIKYKNYVKYYLTINHLGNNVDIAEICNNILKLSVLPSGVSIITRQDTIATSFKNCEKIFANTEIKWKLHNFLDPSIDFDHALYTAMSTNEHFKKCHFIWTVNDKSLLEHAENQNINNINYIVNILQPEIGILKSKHTENSIDGLFMTKKNYFGLTQHVSQHLTIAINEYVKLESINIMLYDN